jgi:integrase/recombinase XerC
MAAKSASVQLETESLLPDYALYLRGERSLAENTVRIYLADLKPFCQYLAQEGLGFTQMDRQVLRGYLAWLATSGRAGEGYARVSIARKLVVVRSFYRFLVQRGLFRSSPVPSGRSFQVKVEKRLPIFLGRRETARLLEAPEDSSPLGLRDRAILEVLYACGVRLAEIAGLDLPSVNLARRELLVRGKGAKERLVVFGGPAGDSLRRYLQDGRPHLLEAVKPRAGRTSPALFLNRYGQRLSRRSIEKLVRQYAGRAGLPEGVHPHTLRHTFATHMLEGDADLRVIQELLGHASPTTTQIYTHVTKQEARQAYLNFHPRAHLPNSPSPGGRGAEEAGADTYADPSHKKGV